MSGVKAVMEQDERKRQAAVQIYIRAGVLKRCDVCGELTEAHSDELIEKSYMIGNSLISKNDPLTKDFKNNASDRLELAAILKNLWTDFSAQCKCKRQAHED